MMSDRPRVVNIDTGAAYQPIAPLAPSGRGPHDPEMEARVTKLEAAIADIKAVLGRLEPAITKIRDDASETKGRVAQMPTTVQLIALVLGIFATSFALLKFTAHP